MKREGIARGYGRKGGGKEEKNERRYNSERGERERQRLD